MSTQYYYIAKLVFRIDANRIILDALDARTGHADGVPEHYDVLSVCHEVGRIDLTDQKFLSQQEPSITEYEYYREIEHLCQLRYIRATRELIVTFEISKRYQYNHAEVIADSIFQFMYLITLDFGYFPIHAAAVSKRQKAVLVVGESGSGKSTLELALLAHGYSFFADDVVFADDKTQLYNSHESVLAISEKTAGMIFNLFDFRLVGAVIRTDSLSRKMMYRIDESLREIRQSCQPRILLFPHRGAVNSIRTITPKQAVSRMIRLFVSMQFSAQQKKGYFDELTKLATASTCLDFEYDGTSSDIILEAVSYIDGCLEEA